ncbi:hydrolase [Helicobacter bilis]|uniref:Hydrolase n=3 Tax=Helicobacter bilis TaxID=37372 RepID=A0A1Q2LJB8_9HELI|nr:NlpC/P60 family protein [Helicobacter bilis]AQQ60493.1 hydrolase [Helicobacter bilis]EMZ41440.1 hypothetical protein C826_00460 [Helicobacter bilis WiWa]TLE02549.1 hydrolase [Helicobacter bilis]TLE04085.1 hydrolase [Helicobacter bilis]
MKKISFISVIMAFMCALLLAKEQVKHVAYSIQVGSFSELKNAGNLADYLNKQGLDAFFFKEKGMYKVRFGNYKDSETARKIANTYKKKSIIDDFFIISPQSYAINQHKPKTHDKVRKNIAKDAHQYIGVPYKWGGTTSSGFDCSGLVRAVYRLNGLTLPRTSIEQYGSGKFVAKNNLKVGDLVFFTNNGKQVNHVGIYIGNNQFIHAPGKGKKVTIANLNTNYWVKAYRGGRTYL